jgi:hypothetical protein
MSTLPPSIKIIPLDNEHDDPRRVTLIGADGIPITTSNRLPVDANLSVSGISISISGIQITFPDAFKIKGSDGQEIDDESVNGKVALDTKSYVAALDGTLIDHSSEASGESLSVSDAARRLKVKFDYVGGPPKSPTYIGLAAPGSATVSGVWRIIQLVYSGVNLMDVLWADGNVNYDNVWDDRLILSYD